MFIIKIKNEINRMLKRKHREIIIIKMSLTPVLSSIEFSTAAIFHFRIEIVEFFTEYAR